MAPGATGSAARAAGERREPELKIGARADVSVPWLSPSFRAEVEVLQVREPDEPKDELSYLIAPISGRGKAWVGSESLEPHR